MSDLFKQTGTLGHWAAVFDGGCWVSEGHLLSEGHIPRELRPRTLGHWDIGQLCLTGAVGSVKAT